MDQKSVSQFPTIVAYLLQDYLTETNPVLRLWAACDAVEMTLRLLVMLGLSDLRRDSPELPPGLIRELRHRIEAPTLGKWRGMAEAIVRFPPRNPMVSELPVWVDQICKILDAKKGTKASSRTSLMALRIRLAHGGGVTKQAAEQLLTLWTPKFEQLVDDLKGLADVALVVLDTDGNLAELRGPSLTLLPYATTPEVQASLSALFRTNSKDVVFVRGDRAAPLWPLKLYGLPQHPDPNMALGQAAVPQTYVRRGETFLQLTPIGSEIVESVSDAAGLALFRELLRLDAPESNERSVRQRTVLEDAIRKDAAQLVGRVAELESLHAQMTAATEGVFWLFGKAGIGKSYVTAKLAADWLDSHNNEDELTIAYRLRIGDAGCSQDAFLRFAADRLEAFLRVGSTSGEALPRLRSLLTQCGPKKVWFLLDGLDEVIQRDARFSEEVVFNLASLPNVVWLCVGRPLPELQSAFRPDRCRIVFENGLPPMSNADIRSLVLENVGSLRKRLLTRDREEEGRVNNEFIDRVAFHADGLPLYVRYVINDIKGGRYRTFDVGEALPKSLDAYHAILLKRLGVGMLAQVLTPLVTTLAAAREPLPVETLHTLLLRRDLVEEGQGGAAQVFTALGAVETMIRRAVTPDGFEGYTIYHDSLRQHMTENSEVAPAVRLSAQSLRRWCAEWLTHRSSYALRQYAEHLFSAQDWTTLFALAENDMFLQAQAARFPSDPDAPLRTLRTALQAAIDLPDAYFMAKFVLRHAKRVVALQQESPLKTLNTDDLTTLPRALALADLFPVEQNILWQLLIVWKLKQGGHLDAARETLEHLKNAVEKRHINEPIFGEDDERDEKISQNRIALFGLFEAMTVNLDLSVFLAERLLNQKNLGDFCCLLASQSDFIEVATSIARGVSHEPTKSRILAAVDSALGVPAREGGGQ